jgi:phosphopantothenoylcysteine decarboxylase/phosphopantothenate--cysteine ligase
MTSSANSTMSSERDMVYDLPPKIENGKWNVHDTKTTVANFVRYISIHEGNELVKKRILVTAGPTATRVDNVRLITNKFSGKLGIEIANELYLRGADVKLYQSYTGIRPPSYIPHHLFADYDEYKKKVLENCHNYDVAVLSAAVADYRPVTTHQGKLPSGGAVKGIELEQTDKVVDLVIEKQPHLKVVSFKYEENENQPFEYLQEVAGKRLKKGHNMVVGNDIHLNGQQQKCFFFQEGKYTEASGKIGIARKLADILEG